MINKKYNQETEKGISEYQELRKKNREINEQPDGYSNCKRDACAFGLSFNEEEDKKNSGACEKHAPILEGQRKEEKILRERMMNLNKS